MGAQRRLMVAAVLLLGGCGGGDGGGQADRNGTRRQAVSHEPGACSPARVRTGAPPSWARLPDVPPPPMPYAIDPSAQVAAFFFTNPLQARTRRAVRNKILWVVGRSVDAEQLTITARSNGATVRASGDAGGGSGQIQRMTIRFPEPGCWRFDLRWGTRRTTLDVRVV